MPERISAWSIYQIFFKKDNSQVYIGNTSEKHWKKYCEVHKNEPWLNDERIAINNKRIAAKDWFISQVESKINDLSKSEIISMCEPAGIPFAPISLPGDLFDDVHLNSGNGLLKSTLQNGQTTKRPNIPLTYNDVKFDIVSNPPNLGEHSFQILSNLGYSQIEILIMKTEGIIS